MFKSGRKVQRLQPRKYNARRHLDDVQERKLVEWITERDGQGHLLTNEDIRAEAERMKSGTVMFLPRTRRQNHAERPIPGLEGLPNAIRSSIGSGRRGSRPKLAA